MSDRQKNRMNWKNFRAYYSNKWWAPIKRLGGWTHSWTNWRLAYWPIRYHGTRNKIFDNIFLIKYFLVKFELFFELFVLNFFLGFFFELFLNLFLTLPFIVDVRSKQIRARSWLWRVQSGIKSRREKRIWRKATYLHPTWWRCCS